MSMTKEFLFCPYCTQPLADAHRGGRPRKVCPSCGFVNYRNPTIGVAVVLMEDGKVLLGRRSADSSFGGRWCIPCGHVEWDEDIRVAAVREFEEETGLVVEPGEVAAVHSNFHNPLQHTVGVWFRATRIRGTIRADDDLDRVQFFEPSKPPKDMAFPTDLLVLQQLANELLSSERSTP
ncbi:MAG: NUDIX domain-containing protein [Planctomycetaceae bacterium]